MQKNVQIHTLFKDKGVLFLGFLFFVAVCFVYFFCTSGTAKPSAVSPPTSLPHEDVNYWLY